MRCKPCLFTHKLEWGRPLHYAASNAPPLTLTPTSLKSRLVVQVAEQRPRRALPHGIGAAAAERVQQRAARGRLLAARKVGDVQRILRVRTLLLSVR